MLKFTRIWGDESLDELTDLQISSRKLADEVLASHAEEGRECHCDTCELARELKSAFKL